MKLPNTQTLFRKAMTGIIMVMTVFVIVILLAGLVRTLSIVKIFFTAEPLSGAFHVVVTEILTFLVIVELFRSFIDYFEAHRFRLSTMIDPAIVFVIRELVVKLYEGKTVDWQTITAFAFLILSLGAVRAMAVRFSPCEDLAKRTECSLKE